MFDTPGVFIREIPSGSRPVAGVATSNTAFVGTFARGPVNEATRVSSFGEFERIFGGLHVLSETSYAVRSFFLNGGSVAFIVRVTDEATTDAIETADCAVGADITFAATSPGTWANTVRIGIAHSAAGTSYTLLVREYNADLDTVLREEAFIDVSITAGNARFVEDVLRENSELIRATQNNVALPTRTQINTTDATSLDDLLEGTAADFTAMGSGTAGNNGTMEGDAGWVGSASAAIRGSEANGTGIYALNAIVPEVFNLLCLPGAANFNEAAHASSVAIYQEAYTFCRNNFAFLVVDTAPDVDRSNFQTYLTELGAAAGPNSALYYPRVTGPDPLNPLVPRVIGPSGMAAGLMARTDGTRGVWKAPAGTEARVVGGTPTDVMTNRQQGPLNTSGVNALRTFPVYNTVVWGARTLDGADARASEWRYINVRRLALFIENSLQRGLQWVVFEPNDEPLWANVRMNVNGFMNQLHRQGAFQGASARDAYLVKCDSETTTQADINLGILNVYVGFAPVRPAEFVVIRIQQRFPNAA